MKKKLLLLLMLIVTSVASWAAEPYFEVVEGSFASGNVTLKITFPEATSVVLEGTYGVGLYMEHAGTSVSAAYDFTGTLTTDGINTVTAVYSDFTPLEDDAKYYVFSYNMKVDGVAYSDKIYSLDSRPYAEVIEGSIGSGSATVKISAPQESSLGFYPTSYPQFYYAALRHNGTEIAQLTIDSPLLTISGNTISAVFSYAATGDEDLANYDVYFNKYCLQFNGEWNDNDATIPFKTNTLAPSGCAHENLTHHDLVESTDQVQGYAAYDECDDCHACFATDDTEHEYALTHEDFILPLDTDPIDYFYLENLEDAPSRAKAPLSKNLECTTTPENPSSWHPVGQDGDALEGHGKMYYRATPAGNTNFANTIFRVGDDDYFPILDSDWNLIGWDEVHDKRHFAIGGDITTLLRSNGKVKTLPEPEIEPVPTGDGETFEEQVNGVFEEMFGYDYNGWLLSAADLKLPSTTLSERCYYGMFTQSKMTEGPAEISAITMAPYSCYHMFEWCHSMAEAPVIKAKTMAAHACEGMFYMGYGNNPLLAYVPDLEVETVGEYSCYNMFANCVNLTKAPEIPATTVAPHCFESMFSECNNLAVAPTILPAMTLAEDCYNSMFHYCYALQRAPELPAPSLVEGCYVQMFYNCYNLNYIKVGLMTDWPVRITYNEEVGYNTYDYYCTRDWVAGITDNGTFCGPTCLFKEYYAGAGLYDVIPYYYNYNTSSYTRWSSETALTVPVTISSVGYATFCYDYNWIIPKGTEGYIAYVDESGVFHFEKGYDAGDIVQSYRSSYETYEDGNLIRQWVCAAVVLKGAPGTYDVMLTDIDAPIYELDADPNHLNDLYGSMHDFDISEFSVGTDYWYGYVNSDFYYYALSLDEDGENVGFYWMEEDGAPFITKPYKAFLRGLKSRVDGYSARKHAFVFEEDGVVTEIKKTTEPDLQQPVIFDLSGRSLQRANKGFYIINGKKVIK